MLPTIDKQLVFDHFADKTTPLQKRRIEEWLCSEANQELFYAWLVEWEQQSGTYLPELEAPLQRFVTHMESISPGSLITDSAVTKSTVPMANRPARFFGSRWRWLVAACLLVGLMVGGWQYRETILYTTYHTTYGQTQLITLTDGSQVDLQASSYLRVPRFGFNQYTREVWLEGEARFAVMHTSDNLKFLVKTDKGFDVLVHGTEFTVNTRSYRANVMLRKGKVQINCSTGNSQKPIFLQPGDLVALEQPDRPQVQHGVQPQLYDQWKEHRFIFDDMTLQEFAKLLTDNYGLSVSIPDKETAQRTLVGSFRADNVDELLQMIAEIFNLRVTRQGNTIRLTENDL